MSAARSQLDPKLNSWMHVQGVRRLMDAIKSGGGEARFVGGCVRDALSERRVGEIDFAVNLTPPDVTRILTAAGLKVVPTGIQHGTVTVVADHIGYEVTTLRRDVETDGRHAKVEFTDDWQSDAARRDFTFNALYADANGTVFDYFGGSTDLASGHVRFIGDARDRIKEDVLRILRFFRFYASFGAGAIDKDGLNACGDLAALIPQLSAERVWRETAKLLRSENPHPAWQIMLEHGITQHFLPEAQNLGRLSKTLEAERKFGDTSSGLLRLAALINAGAAEDVSRRLKLSRVEAESLVLLGILPEKLRGHLDPVPFRRLLYMFGAKPLRDAALLLAAEDRGEDVASALEEAANWVRPKFPIFGSDLLGFGLKEGPELGRLLKDVEEWWIENDFRADRGACLKEAQRRKTASGL